MNNGTLHVVENSAVDFAVSTNKWFLVSYTFSTYREAQHASAQLKPIYA